MASISLLCAPVTLIYIYVITHLTTLFHHHFSGSSHLRQVPSSRQRERISICFLAGAYHQKPTRVRTIRCIDPCDGLRRSPTGGQRFQRCPDVSDTSNQALSLPWKASSRA